MIICTFVTCDDPLPCNNDPLLIAYPVSSVMDNVFRLLEGPGTEALDPGVASVATDRFRVETEIISNTI